MSHVAVSDCRLSRGALNPWIKRSAGDDRQNLNITILVFWECPELKDLAIGDLGWFPYAPKFHARKKGGIRNTPRRVPGEMTFDLMQIVW